MSRPYAICKRTVAAGNAATLQEVGVTLCVPTICASVYWGGDKLLCICKL